MTQVVLGLGSNVSRRTHLRCALAGLKALGPLDISPIVESDPVGYSSASRFYNLVVGFHTNIAVEQVIQLCKRLEREAGRSPDEPRFSPKTLDVDILLWNDDAPPEALSRRLPHPDILQHAHVLCPLALLYPDHRHPTQGQTYQTLWEARRAAFPKVIILPNTLLLGE